MGTFRKKNVPVFILIILFLSLSLHPKLKKNIHIMRKILLLLMLIVSIGVFSQNDSPLNKSPFQASFEVGYKNIFSIIDRSTNPFTNKFSNGFGALLDVAWKVKGLNGSSPAVYISVPLGYSMLMAADNNSKNGSMLNYGWTIRHELTKDKKVTPFVSYGLLLNTLRIKDIAGGVMGHQTMFEGGANFNTNGKLKYYAKAAYSYASFPKLGDSKRIHLQFIDVSVGLRY